MHPSQFGPLEDIAEKVIAGGRLSFEEGVRLYKSQDLPALGNLAQIVRKRINGERVFYSVNLHLNHTNVCTLRCIFCAFARRPGEEGGYTMSLEEIKNRVREGIQNFKVNEIHITGGHNPELDIDYFTGMMRTIREVDSDIYIKAFTAPEIDDIAKRSGLSWEEVLKELKLAGQDGMPGGGAEIFAPKTRKRHRLFELHGSILNLARKFKNIHLCPTTART